MPRNFNPELDKIWQQALAEPKGIEIKMQRKSAATALRMQLYRHRKLLRDESVELYQMNEPGYGKTPYDNLHMEIKVTLDGVVLEVYHREPIVIRPRGA